MNFGALSLSRDPASPTATDSTILGLSHTGNVPKHPTWQHLEEAESKLSNIHLYDLSLQHCMLIDLSTRTGPFFAQRDTFEVDSESESQDGMDSQNEQETPRPKESQESR